MSDLPKQYDPTTVEEKWYEFWEKNGFFVADPNSEKPPYCIVLPPPNVTGVLHMGHAMVNTLQDILIRYKKMSGFETLWLPGTDHAGISTQTVVERHLHAKTGKRKVEFSREEFLGHVWDWKTQHENTILSQLKKVGCSLDWSRLRFTLDEQSSHAVKVMFKKMFDDGLIYRGDYLVNWDPILQTAIADDEVEYEERDSCLWYMRYPIEDSEEFLVIATTRPETMLGDVAVAVAPSDERYAKSIGKNVILPITERKVPIIADRMVDPEFGTGAVKITPAHDFNDHEVATRHDLPLINIMHPDGTLNEECGEFAGITMEEGREEIVSRLRDLGLIEKIEPYTHRVGVSYRTKAVIEPYMSKQWFVKMSHFKDTLLSAVKESRVKVVPEGWEKTYCHWIDNLRDWCISRQLWWGHRIPIWYHKVDPSQIICHAGDGEPEEVKQNPDDWYQEEDVLDTWFSSALWPMSTLGWPNKTPEFEKFYPNATLITGHDILFFWVARMILMGEYATGNVPFTETFIHGLIFGKSYWRTADDGAISYVLPQERLAFETGESDIPDDVYSKWEKMSKSTGNVIDPIEIISEFGADAMRLALCSSVTHARQIDLDRRRFDEYKNFTNKVWNATRFIMMNLDAHEKSGLPPLTRDELCEDIDASLFTIDDRWILTRLNLTIGKVTHSLDSYMFDVAAKESYQFFWDEFCSYYLELVKPYLFGRVGNEQIRRNKQKILVATLLASIRILHPIAPFITQEIFNILKSRFSIVSEVSPSSIIQDVTASLASETIMVTPFPKILKEYIFESDLGSFAFLEEIVYAIRNIRGEMKIPLSTPVDVYLVASNDDESMLMENNHSFIAALVNVGSINVSCQVEPKLPSASTAAVRSCKVFIPLPEGLKDAEKERLNKELEKLQGTLKSLQSKLSNQAFLEKAPEQLVKNTQSMLQDTQSNITSIEAKLQEL